MRLRVRLTPRASRNMLEGVVRDAEGRALLQLRLKAPPVEGAANTALIAFLATELKLRKRDIDLVSGTKSRVKILQLNGDPSELVRRLERWIAQAA
ncbi:DUF167 domain-containing protein [Fodinicurvata halophila]|uniref:UPF0235 protein ACFOW6_10140 n=1 Tax=Fodinicurvata halophila TaxID=1419723 RepID=A0ABV8ULY4_9PROT